MELCCAEGVENVMSNMDEAFRSMPWVARLRGACVATPSAFPCVEEADTNLCKIGTGDDGEREHQWAALALSTIAPADAMHREGLAHKVSVISTFV